MSFASTNKYTQKSDGIELDKRHPSLELFFHFIHGFFAFSCSQWHSQARLRPPKTPPFSFPPQRQGTLSLSRISQESFKLVEFHLCFNTFFWARTCFLLCSLKLAFGNDLRPQVCRIRKIEHPQPRNHHHLPRTSEKRFP